MKRFSNIFAPLVLRLQRIKYGKHCKFYGFPIIAGKNITIGSHVTVASGFLSNLVGLYQRSVIVCRNSGQIHIGDHVGMSGVTVYSFCRIEIGDHTLIGGNTKILDSDMHPVDPSYRLQNPQDREHMGQKEVIIGNNVFIGCNCLILKGVHIGDNAVIGAGSVVTKDIPENCVAAGNPARVVKKLTEENAGGESL